MTATAAAPPLTGGLAADAAALAAFTGGVEEVLAGLPAKPGRTADQQRRASAVLDSARAARTRFMTRHAEGVYAALTGDRTRRPRLDELVTAAAVRFPGLVPSADQRAAERALRQADRDGREIDQGIFFSCLLRSPVAGAHLVDTMLTPTPDALALVPEFTGSGRLDLGPVRVERRGGTAHLTVHNGQCLNAEDDPLAQAMETAVDVALLDERTRVGVLRGGVMDHPRYRGRRVFSAGINLAHLRDGRISYVDFLLRRELGYVHKIYRGLLSDVDSASPVDRMAHKPWVAAVDSFAIGGGMQLLLVFDLVIAADNAYFSLPAAREGIVPGVANLRLGRLAGGRLTRQVILTGRRIFAAEPAGALLCDRVVPENGVTAAVETAAAELDNPAVLANRAMLHLAEEPVDRFREYLAEFALAQAFRLYSADVLSTVDSGPQANGERGSGQRGSG